MGGRLGINPISVRLTPIQWAWPPRRRPHSGQIAPPRWPRRWLGLLPLFHESERQVEREPFSGKVWVLSQDLRQNPLPRKTQRKHRRDQWDPHPTQQEREVRLSKVHLEEVGVSWGGKQEEDTELSFKTRTQVLSSSCRRASHGLQRSVVGFV